MVAAGEQPLAHPLQVGLVAVQFQARAMVAQGDGDGRQVSGEVGRIAVLAIAQQVQHGVLLALGPLALARHERARGR
ncbi:hypothetical protein D3C72_2270220 [compost metagenome]